MLVYARSNLSGIARRVGNISYVRSSLNGIAGRVKHSPPLVNILVSYKYLRHLLRLNVIISNKINRTAKAIESCKIF